MPGQGRTIGIILIALRWLFVLAPSVLAAQRSRDQ